jgi:hypothetical protein
MFKVCIIDTNNVSFTQNDNIISKFTLDDIEDYLEEYLSIKNIKDNENFIETIINEININQEVMIHTTNFYQTNNLVYQMYHISTYNYENTKDIDNQIKLKKRNGIANILLDSEYNVYGKVIISKVKINLDNSLSYLDMSIKDMYEVFRNKKIQKGLLVNVDNSIEEIEFINHPLSWIDIKKGFNYKFYEIQIFDKILMFFIQIEPEKNTYNKLASELFKGENPINGNVFIAIRNKITDARFTENTYINFDKELFYKLRELMLQEDFEKNQEPYGYDTESLKYENFYTLTNSIYSNYLKKNINTIKEYNFDNKKESLNNITKIISKK